MAEEKIDEKEMGEELMENSSFYKKKSLRLLILVLTIAVLVIPIFMFANIIMGRPAFFLF